MLEVLHKTVSSQKRRFSSAINEQLFHERLPLVTIYTFFLLVAIERVWLIPRDVKLWKLWKLSTLVSV